MFDHTTWSYFITFLSGFIAGIGFCGAIVAFVWHLLGKDEEKP